MSRNSKGIDNVTKNVIKVSMRLIIYALMILVMIKGATMAYSFGHGIFYAASVEPPPGRDIEVSIPENISTASAADMLKQKGLIVSKFSFEVQAKFFEYKIKPGNYILNTSQTSRQILDILNVGPEEKRRLPLGLRGNRQTAQLKQKLSSCRLLKRLKHLHLLQKGRMCRKVRHMRKPLQKRQNQAPRLHRKRKKVRQERLHRKQKVLQRLRKNQKVLQRLHKSRRGHQTAKQKALRLPKPRLLKRLLKKNPLKSLIKNQIRLLQKRRETKLIWIMINTITGVLAII